jgi:hypothetical protein
MSQLNAPVRRKGGDLDVYTGLLFAALLILVAGIALLVLRNMEHSAVDGRGGGPITLIDG